MLLLLKMILQQPTTTILLFHRTSLFSMFSDSPKLFILLSFSVYGAIFNKLLLYNKEMLQLVQKRTLIAKVKKASS